MATEGLKDVEVGNPIWNAFFPLPLWYTVFVFAFSAVRCCGALTAGQPLHIKLDTHNSLMQGQIESNYDETVDNFDSMDLKPELLRGKQIGGFFFRIFFFRGGVHSANFFAS